MAADPSVPVTPNKGYPLPPDGYTGPSGSDWGTYVNAFLTSIIDANLGGRYQPNVAGNSDSTVSSSNASNLYHSLGGAITGNIRYVLPNNGGMYLLFNGTTGNFKITAAPAGGSGSALPQGRTSLVFVNPDTNTANVFPLGSALIPYASNPLTNGALTLGNSYQYVSLALTGNATINPPNNPYDGQEYFIKDTSGGCATFTATFSGTIDGATNRAINLAYGFLRIRYDATAGAWFQS